MLITYKRVLFVHCCWCGVFLVTPQCQDKQFVHQGSTFSSDQDYAEITVTLGHYVELRCCASSFSKIVWYKEEGKTWNPVHLEPARFNPLAPTLAEEGQVLVVKSARENDAGNYKCVLEKDGRDVDKRIMALTVSECDELTRGPYMIAPVPCEITPVPLDGTVTLPCNGYFGCGDDDLRTATWLVTESRGTTQWRVAPDVSDRYSINYVKRNGNSELGAYLTIINVQQEDLDRKFMCILSTPQVIHGESKLIVQLQRQSRESTADSASMNLIFLTVACAVLAVVLILMTVVYCTRRKIKRNGKARCPSNEEIELPSHTEEERTFTSASMNMCDV